MGQLLKGKTLSWKETVKMSEPMQNAATKQLIQSYGKHKNDISPLSSLQWGYEIEYFIVKADEKSINLFPCSDKIIDFLNSLEDHGRWNPEYASFMVECIPIKPFYLIDEAKQLSLASKENSSIIHKSLGDDVFDNIKNQKSILNSSLRQLYGSNIFSCEMGSFPMLGAKILDSQCPFSLSNRFPTSFINEHPRFATLTRNIVERRNKTPVNIILPVFKDKFTTVESIHMDAMGFGMGCCCLQTTTEMECFEEACRIYDELLVFSPIALALTASSPVFAGIISGHDTRWKVLESAVDDRNSNDLDTLGSRYSPSKLYLSQDNKEYNDVEVPIHLSTYEAFRNADIPECFSKHYANIFYRNPLIAYEGINYNDIGIDETTFIDALQSTNWNSVRFKLPISNAGYRIEFRPMEVQPSSFENSAFSIFIEGLIIALIKAKKCGVKFSFVVPISDTLKNFNKAIEMDTLLLNRFKWRVSTPSNNVSRDENHCRSDEEFNSKENNKIETVTIDDIINDESCGIIALIRKYAQDFYLDNQKYFDLISKRASGENETPARRIRKIILEHPEYQQDSKINNSILKSILETMNFE